MPVQETHDDARPPAGSTSLAISRWLLTLGVVSMLGCSHPAPDTRTAEHVARGFDRVAVERELARVDVTQCEPREGLVGSSHVTILFEADGTISTATVDDYDWESNRRMGIKLAGSPTAECVERRFRAVRIPPFSPGPPIRIGRIVSFGLYRKRS